MQMGQRSQYKIWIRRALIDRYILFLALYTTSCMFTTLNADGLWAIKDDCHSPARIHAALLDPRSGRKYASVAILEGIGHMVCTPFLHRIFVSHNIPGSTTSTWKTWWCVVPGASCGCDTGGQAQTVVYLLWLSSRLICYPTPMI